MILSLPPWSSWSNGRSAKESYKKHFQRGWSVLQWHIEALGGCHITRAPPEVQTKKYLQCQRDQPFFLTSTGENRSAWKGKKCMGCKKSKGQLTVLVGGSLAGEKLPLLVIGRSKHAWSFAGVKSFPTAYEANTKAKYFAPNKMYLKWIS